jgi:uncharacterized membrane protein AbrB (regulator of aidB expression)
LVSWTTRNQGWQFHEWCLNGVFRLLSVVQTRIERTLSHRSLAVAQTKLGANQTPRFGSTLLNHQTRIAPTTTLARFLILTMALALIAHFVPQ